MASGEVDLRHGVDLVAIDRIGDLLERHGEQFLERCFTAQERAYADAGKKRRVERYAARFACKEAVMKALGTGWRDGIAWTDVGVVNEPSGRPVLRLTGKCRELADQQGLCRWEISLSHAGDTDPATSRSRGYAVASVIAWGETAPDALSETASVASP